MTKFGWMLGGAALVATAPAAAVTFSFGGTPTQTDQTSYSYAAGGITATVQGYSYPDTAYAPSAFITFASGRAESEVLAALTLTNLSRDAIGLGVCSAGNNANDCAQVETNGRNELIRISLTATDPAVTLFRLDRAVFSFVDADDTLGLFGVDAAGVVRRIGFTGVFDGPGTGTGFGTGASGSGTNGATGVYTVDFDVARYRTFYFANNNGSSDGYRLNAVTVSVPEPAAWGTMALGFGLTGASLRRRRPLVA